MHLIKKKNILSSLEFVWLFFITGGFLVTSSWTADMLQYLLEGKGDLYFENGLLSFAYVFTCLAFAFLIYRSRSHFVPTKTLYATRPKPHKVLIMLVSTPNQGMSIDGKWITIEKKNNSQESSSFTLPTALDEMIQLITERGLFWNWQQNLRSLAVHQERVEKVILIGSASTQDVIKVPNDDDKHVEKTNTVPGSVENLDEICQLLKHFVPHAEFFDNRENPCDFHVLEEIRSTIVQWVVKMIELGYQQEDIIVDVTGGTKTASISAAMATLTLSDVEFQYIPERKIDAQAYNVVMTSQARLE